MDASGRGGRGKAAAAEEGERPASGGGGRSPLVVLEEEMEAEARDLEGLEQMEVEAGVVASSKRLRRKVNVQSATGDLNADGALDLEGLEQMKAEAGVLDDLPGKRLRREVNVQSATGDLDVDQEDTTTEDRELAEYLPERPPMPPSPMQDSVVLLQKRAFEVGMEHVLQEQDTSLNLVDVDPGVRVDSDRYLKVEAEDTSSEVNDEEEDSSSEMGDLEMEDLALYLGRDKTEVRDILKVLDLDFRGTMITEVDTEVDDGCSDNDLWKYYDDQTEKEMMAGHRNLWEGLAKFRGSSCKYEDETSYSSTARPLVAVPSYRCKLKSSLQVYSIKVTKLREECHLRWPIEVYGMVAARDNVDGRRNILFCREIHNCQILTSLDQFLELTGPSRAIMYSDLPDFEIQLKVKRSQSEGEVLINRIFEYKDSSSRFFILANRLCAIKLNIKRLVRTVQATIGSITVDDQQSWPSGCRWRIVARTASCIEELVLLDSETPDVDTQGSIVLSRRVISVEFHGQLIIGMEAYSLPAGDHDKGEQLALGSVTFIPKISKDRSEGTCQLSSQLNRSWDVKITVAVDWSFIDPRDRV